MKILNRGFLIVKPKQAFWNWANEIDSEITYDENDSVEGTTYLIEEDFFDIEPLLEKNFKKIFRHELTMITEEETFWPEERAFEDFLTWFEIDFGSIVVDLEKEDLVGEKI